MKKLMVASLLITASALAMAKLPPPSDEAKAKAAEAAAKAAWSGKVDAYLSCKAQDRAAAHYYKTAKAANKDVKPATAMPACADPGAFSYVPVVVTKPIEAAGAHSAAPTATSPPSSTTPAAAIAPAKKP
ncbi:hypothetical protein [Rhodoferax sp.]|uniref:hypothetical protein n=1 Tax=Rhodoferax sp. TaxID=50421 RepID=UPI002727495B|nr:hypothetical protein [Rhodoferax sp.]MDO9199611.1 hypothetical protein [Rhodoferax sp.]